MLTSVHKILQRKEIVINLLSDQQPAGVTFNFDAGKKRKLTLNPVSSLVGLSFYP